MNKNILLAVLVAVVAVDGSILGRHRRQADPSCKSVERAALTCVGEVPARLLDSSLWVNYTNPPISIPVNQLCGELREFKNCLAAKARSCSEQDPDAGTTAIIDYVVAGYGYVCSPEGIATVTEMMSSPCNSRDGMSMLMRAMSSACSDIMPNEDEDFSSDLCPQLAASSACYNEAVASACGDAAGRFYDEAWYLFHSTPGVMRGIYGFHCSF